MGHLLCTWCKIGRPVAALFAFQRFFVLPKNFKWFEWDLTLWVYRGVFRLRSWWLRTIFYSVMKIVMKWLLIRFKRKMNHIWQKRRFKSMVWDRPPITKQNWLWKVHLVWNRPHLSFCSKRTMLKVCYEVISFKTKF